MSFEFIKELKKGREEEGRKERRKEGREGSKGGREERK
jgi:hypothetical protein